MQQSELRLKPISNVQKSFSLECQICYEEFNNIDIIPMIICSNYHSLCSKCVKEKLFKKEYDDKKNHTGRYKCSKCSEIIKNENIRQHKMLKQICSNLIKIKQKDQQLKKQLYNSIGTMGMNILSKNMDFQIIQKTNSNLKIQNSRLLEENVILKSKLERIQQIKGSLQKLQKIQKQSNQLKFQKMLAQAQLYSIKQKISRQKDTYQQLNQQCIELRKQIKSKAQRKKNLSEQIEGHINLKEYLQQQILQLKSFRKQFQKQFDKKKQKFSKTISEMEITWKKFIDVNYEQSSQKCLKDCLQTNKMKEKSKSLQKQRLALKINKIETINSQNENQLLKKKSIRIEEKQMVNKENQKQKNFKIDFSQKTTKNFQIQNNVITLSNNKSGTYLHFSAQNAIQEYQSKKFSIKIKKAQDFSLMIGLISKDGKRKKNLFNRDCFVGLDCSELGRIWKQGESQRIEQLKLKENDVIQTELSLTRNQIRWSVNDKFVKSTIIPNSLKNKQLYPVVLMINQEDQIQILQEKKQK